MKSPIVSEKRLSKRNARWYHERCLRPTEKRRRGAANQWTYDRSDAGGRLRYYAARGRSVRSARRRVRAVKGAAPVSTKSIAVPVVRKRRAAGTAASANTRTASEDGAARRQAPDAPTVKRRFRVGQQLRIVGSGRNWGRVGGLCKVLALLPHDAGPLLYRIRVETENFERVVAESDLATLNPEPRDNASG